MCLNSSLQGLSEKQIRLCDSFVYIPQYGPGTASLNVAVATSIILHHFAMAAGYEERSRTGFKFDLADRPRRKLPRGYIPPTAEERAADRAAAALEGDAEVEGMDFSELGLPEMAENLTLGD